MAILKSQKNLLLNILMGLSGLIAEDTGQLRGGNLHWLHN